MVTIYVGRPEILLELQMACFIPFGKASDNICCVLM